MLPMRSVLLQQSADQVRSIGFPRSESPLPRSASATPVATPNAVGPSRTQNPASLPTKNTSHKGRWFVTAVIGTLLGYVAVSLWSAFFHYQAHGVLQGTTIQLSAFSASQVRAMYVQEGDLVQAGQLLAELDAPDLELQWSQVNRQLHMASLDLQVRLAELNSIDRQIQSDQIDRQARYHQLLGDVHLNNARLEDFANTFENNKKLLQEHAVSKSELLASKTAFEGQQAQLLDLNAALC